MGIVYMIDPRRITDRLFGGPHFSEFLICGTNRMKCPRTGDAFDTRGINDAWMEGRNLAPILKGTDLRGPQ